MPAYRDKRDGRWRYRKWVRVNGKRTRITGTPATNTKAASLDAERRHIERVLSGVKPQPKEVEPTEIPTVREYQETFLAAYKPDQKACERRSKTRILRLLADFDDLRLDEVTQEHIGRWVSKQTTAPKTINNRLAVLSSLLRFAAENGVIQKPRLRMTVSSMAAELVSVPMDEVDRLLIIAPPLLRVAILLASEAGLRAGEIRGLQWTDVKEQITIRRALDTDTDLPQPPKHNKTRTVPISDRLASELKRLPRKGIWVLTTDGRPLSHRRGLYLPILDLYDRAEVPLPPSPVHCLRHTFGTELAAKGVPLPVIQELMGHSKIETTRRYIHVNAAQKSDAIRTAFGQQTGNDSEKPSQVP